MQVSIEKPPERQHRAPARRVPRRPALHVMRSPLVLVPFCVLLLSPVIPVSAWLYFSDGGKEPEAFPFDGKPFVDDGAELPDAKAMAKLAEKDPVAFLENCLRRYQRDVKGYTCIMQKQERTGEMLQPTEVIAVSFREKPFSARLRWQDGARLADAALYIDGENQEKDKNGNDKSMMICHPAGIAGKLVKFVSRDPEGEEARQSGRYSLPQFGIEKGTQRTLAAWKAARAKGELRVEYLGEVKVKEADDRPCYKFRRPKSAKPEEDGVTDRIIYIDKETWLQVGSVLKGDKGQYIAQYFFRDIKVNPDFKADAFSKEALTK